MPNTQHDPKSDHDVANKQIDQALGIGGTKSEGAEYTNCPECYTCSKCGRIIGSPLPQPTMNQIPNIEDFKKAIDEGVMVDEHGFIYIKKAELFRLMDKYTHQQLQKAREEFKERIDGFLNEMKAEIGISNEYKLGYRQALLDLKEAYHSELDQDTPKSRGL